VPSTTRGATSFATIRQFPTLYGTRKFITEFTKALHLYLSWAKPIQSTTFNPVRTSQETYISATELSQLMLCKIWGFHGGVYEECRLLGYKNPVRTSQETHYVSVTECSRLMIYEIWGFHSGDYEECRLLGYKNPVHTSQETHYFSATELSQLMLCKIWGFHCGNYEECRLLQSFAVWLL
jgi:hypothetical protein